MKPLKVILELWRTWDPPTISMCVCQSAGLWELVGLVLNFLRAFVYPDQSCSKREQYQLPQKVYLCFLN